MPFERINFRGYLLGRNYARSANVNRWLLDPGNKESLAVTMTRNELNREREREREKEKETEIARGEGDLENKEEKS